MSEQMNHEFLQYNEPWFFFSRNGHVTYTGPEQASKFPHIVIIDAAKAPVHSMLIFGDEKKKPWTSFVCRRKQEVYFAFSSSADAVECRLLI